MPDDRSGSKGRDSRNRSQEHTFSDTDSLREDDWALRVAGDWGPAVRRGQPGAPSAPVINLYQVSLAKVTEITLFFWKKTKPKSYVLSIQCHASPLKEQVLWTSASLTSLLTCFFLRKWMQDNLQDTPSSLLSRHCESFNIIPSEKRLIYRCKKELPFTVTSYLTLRMNVTQAEIWKIRIKSMSEYVLAALVKCPLTPVSPSGPPTASSGFRAINPHFQRQEAKTSAYGCDSPYQKSLALSYKAI